MTQTIQRWMRVIRYSGLAGAIAFVSVAAIAQDGEPAVETTQYKSYLVGGELMEFGGENAMGPRLLSGDASIVFEAEDPADNMTVLAETITFFYPDDAQADMPSRITLEGGVDIDHPDGKVRAQRADVEFAGGSMTDADSLIMNLFGNVSVTTETGTIQSEVASVDFESGDAVFRRNVRGEGEQFKGLVADEAQANLKTNYFKISKGQMRLLDLSTSDPAAGLLLTAADISDLSGLLVKIRAEAGAEGATPGKHLVLMLPVDAQTPMLRVDVANLVQQSDLVLKQLNSALRKPALYDAAAWQGVAVPAAAQPLVDAAPDGLEEGEIVLRNRWLLHAAYPSHVAPPNG